jgi:hypothetical protein
MYERTGGRLIPKAIGKPFKRAVKYGQRFKYGEVTSDTSNKNAIAGHQRNSSRFPSSGVSTTPILKNAKAYATHRGRFKSGFIFKIDTELLTSSRVEAYEVSDYVQKSAIPEDKEVILVAIDCGSLPADIVVQTIKV